MGAVAFKRGLVGHWPMDERSGGTVYDQSPKGNNDGTIYGAIFARGKLGWALDFDGVDDNVDIGDIENLGQDFTTSLWSYRTGSTGSYGSLFNIDYFSWGSTGGFRVFDWNDGRIVGWLSNVSAGTAVSLELETNVPNNEWRYYTIRWDKPTFTVYRNGVQVDNATWNYDVGWDTFRTLIGRGADFFKGRMDEVAIYDRALSESEIKDLYYYGIEPSPRHVPRLGAKV